MWTIRCSCHTGTRTQTAAKAFLGLILHRLLSHSQNPIIGRMPGNGHDSAWTEQLALQLIRFAPCPEECCLLPAAHLPPGMHCSELAWFPAEGQKRRAHIISDSCQHPGPELPHKGSSGLQRHLAKDPDAKDRGPQAGASDRLVGHRHAPQNFRILKDVTGCLQGQIASTNSGCVEFMGTLAAAISGGE